MTAVQDETASKTTPTTDTNRRKKSYVILCSPAHSGSTLIACLGAAHPGISTVGEFTAKFSSSGRCSCDVAYNQCEFWQRWCQLAADVGLAYAPGSVDFTIDSDATDWRWARWYHHPFPWKFVDRMRDSLMHRTSYHRSIQAKLRNIVRMAQLLCEDERTPTFLDTSKNGWLIQPLLAQHEMDVRCIMLVRDGRAATLSLVKWYRFPFDEAVERWLWQIRLMQRTVRYVPQAQLLSLRHEDFLREPTRMIPELFEFCGVNPEAQLDFSKHRRHIVGNAMRYTFDGNLRSDESWRSKITADELEYFNKRAGHVNRSLGYLD